MNNELHDYFSREFVILNVKKQKFEYRYFISKTYSVRFIKINRLFHNDL